MKRRRIGARPAARPFSPSVPRQAVTHRHHHVAMCWRSSSYHPRLSSWCWRWWCYFAAVTGAGAVAGAAAASLAR
eukprot:4617507-Alexandrium_andersonii.AAC.1